MLVIAAFLLVVFGASVRGLRTAGGGPRWPFLVASTLSGGALLALVMAAVIALTAGRDTWNSWVSGSPSSETVTLWVVLIVGPVLLSTCIALLIIGAVLRTRQRRRSGQASSR
jgi:RsiW-degrading membrane proteinase PrsW (M82 family)